MGCHVKGFCEKQHTILCQEACSQCSGVSYPIALLFLMGLLLVRVEKPLEVLGALCCQRLLGVSVLVYKEVCFGSQV